MSKLTPEAQAELDAFAEHVHRHQSGVEGCRFCLERAVKRLTVPTPASKSDTGGPMPDARREGMTADDVTYCRRRSEDSEHQTDVHFYLRILATYHALAASQQNVEWWKGHHARLMDEAQSQLDALRTQLAAAREDSAHWRDYAIHLAHCRECGTSNVHCVRGQEFRDACFDFDTARSTDAERTHGETR